MDNEDLFVMLDECIAYASELLISKENLESFAMVLEPDNNIRSLSVNEKSGEARYEAFLAALRGEAKEDKIIAMALLSNVTIPDNFNAPVNSGIRVHIEEKAFEADNTLSARLLYIPYQLYRTKEDEKTQIQLHNPIPVGLKCEVFV